MTMKTNNDNGRYGSGSLKTREMSQLYVFVQSLDLTKLRGSLLLKSVTSK